MTTNDDNISLFIIAQSERSTAAFTAAGCHGRLCGFKSVSNATDQIVWLFLTFLILSTSILCKTVITLLKYGGIAFLFS